MNHPGLKKVEWILFGGLLLGLNLPMLAGAVSSPFIFQPDAFMDGNWPSLLLHTFVHVSPYHLLIDGIGFAVVWSSLRERSGLRRAGYFLGSALGSAGLTWLMAPQLGQIGFCGLSGTAHGILGVVALEMIRRTNKDPLATKMGWITLGLVSSKCLYELARGKIFLAFLHFGDLGTPLVASHMGGLLGGCLLFWLLNRVKPKIQSGGFRRSSRLGSRPSSAYYRSSSPNS